jgi:serine/threonine-protein kinase
LSVRAQKAKELVMGLTTKTIVAVYGFLFLAPAKVDFGYPIFLAIGPDRTIYVSDQNVPAIYKIASDGTTTTLYRGQKQYRTPLYRPRGLAVEKDGSLVVCDPATMDVYRLAPNGKATPMTGKKVKLLNGVETTMGDVFIQPEGIAAADDGTVYVTDLKLRAVFRIGKDNKPIKLADVPAPRGIAIDRDGSLLVVSHSDGQLRRVTRDGKVTAVVGGRPFGFPLSICVRADGNYVITDNYSKALWLVTPQGKVEKLVEGDPLKNPTSVAIDNQGNLAIADPHSRKVFWLSPQKQFTVAAESK